MFASLAFVKNSADDDVALGTSCEGANASQAVVSMAAEQAASCIIDVLVFIAVATHFWFWFDYDYELTR